MRSVILATSVALALGSIPAAAQITSRVTAANNNATPSTTATTQATTPSSGTEIVTTAPAPSPTTTAADTSSTTAGGASNAVGTNTTTLDPAAVGTVGSGPAVTNPDGTVLGTTGVNVVGERVPAPSNGAAAAPTPSFSIVNTPTFDQAAREGRAKEQARKARGQEPRVYGIAPRTENDLTHQMPDDKIIRY